MSLAATLRDAVRGPGAGWRLAGAALIATTVAAQHPHQLFNRIRTRDPLSVVPNWRFFAPHPAIHDSHLLYRTLSADDETSDWTQLSLTPDRTVQHAIWFPDRRLGKAIFDVGDEILRNLPEGFPVVTKLPSYRTLVNYLRREIRESAEGTRAKGFQFAFARSTGYDMSEEPEMMFISPYTPMDPVPSHVRAG
ncbi:hypothetical protein H181DRAFT_02924 [Streptomyces sp. WMMB 714]|uniref:hypothetical protein n=1 Tax=Streptomyces sp. WMMB 714 TaxID=1286822 RepID=UPI0005F8916A|nr:hypothetical protein [Streptomyces sp. WMMB 714]SCK35439.1 hypothetical protein H181DRAFT_02924 [Streptomyces sp. WMMB 714]